MTEPVFLAKASRTRVRPKAGDRFVEGSSEIDANAKGLNLVSAGSTPFDIGADKDATPGVIDAFLWSNNSQIILHDL